eukprot:PRCOL_00006964-RA
MPLPAMKQLAPAAAHCEMVQSALMPPSTCVKSRGEGRRVRSALRSHAIRDRAGGVPSAKACMRLQVPAHARSHRAAGKTGSRGPAATADGTYLDVNGEPLRVGGSTDPGDLVEHGGDVGLAAEPRVDGHDEDVVDHVEDVEHHLGRRVGVERDRGRAAHLADLRKGAVQVHARLNVDDDHARLAIGALGRLDVLLEHRVAVVVRHHELGLEGGRAVLAARRDHLGAEGQVRDEVAVHHVCGQQARGRERGGVSGVSTHRFAPRASLAGGAGATRHAPNWMRSTPASSRSLTHWPMLAQSAGRTLGMIWMGRGAGAASAATAAERRTRRACTRAARGAEAALRLRAAISAREGGASAQRATSGATSPRTPLPPLTRPSRVPTSHTASQTPRRAAYHPTPTATRGPRRTARARAAAWPAHAARHTRARMRFDTPHRTKGHAPASASKRIFQCSRGYA